MVLSRMANFKQTEKHASEQSVTPGGKQIQPGQHPLLRPKIKLHLSTPPNHPEFARFSCPSNHLQLIQQEISRRWILGSRGTHELNELTTPFTKVPNHMESARALPPSSGQLRRVQALSCQSKPMPAIRGVDHIGHVNDKTLTEIWQRLLVKR